MLRTRPRWELAGPVVVGLAALAAGGDTVVVALEPGTSTTHALASAPPLRAALLAGMALLLVGIASSSTPRTRRMGYLEQLAAMAWLASIWMSWPGAPHLVWSAAAVATLFSLQLTAHVVLAFPDGEVRTPLGRALLVTAYPATGVVALGLALFRDPFHDPTVLCASRCPVNLFLVRSVPELVRGFERADRWLVVAAAAALAATCVGRLLRASWPVRRTLILVDSPAVVLAGTIAVQWTLYPRVSVVGEEPSSLSATTSVIAASAAALLAVGLACGAARPMLQRRAVDRLVASLGDAPAPGMLQAALGEAAGDRSLRIAYWRPGSRAFVDATGAVVPPPAASSGRGVTLLARGDERVALVTHAAGLSIEHALGPAVRLALQNERLRAERLAQLEELRASRARIVEAGDAERRRLERDLHDGAQQRLLTALYEIRLGRTAAESVGDTATATALTAVLAETQATLEELRDLAHGIYPAVLSEAGLAAALETLADTAPVRLRTAGVAEIRCAPSSETAAYLLIAEAVEHATNRGAGSVTAITSREGTRLVVDVADDATAPGDATLATADRVRALGGTIEVSATALHAELPCG